MGVFLKHSISQSFIFFTNFYPQKQLNRYAELVDLLSHLALPKSHTKPDTSKFVPNCKIAYFNQSTRTKKSLNDIQAMKNHQWKKIKKKFLIRSSCNNSNQIQQNKDLFTCFILHDNSHSVKKMMTLHLYPQYTLNLMTWQTTSYTLVPWLWWKLTQCLIC